MPAGYSRNRRAILEHLKLCKTVSWGWKWNPGGVGSVVQCFLSRGLILYSRLKDLSKRCRRHDSSHPPATPSSYTTKRSARLPDCRLRSRPKTAPHTPLLQHHINNLRGRAPSLTHSLFDHDHGPLPDTSIPLTLEPARDHGAAYMAEYGEAPSTGAIRSARSMPRALAKRRSCVASCLSGSTELMNRTVKTGWRRGLGDGL